MCAHACACWLVCAGALVLVAGAGAQQADRSEQDIDREGKLMSPMPFRIEMRYGRSSAPLRHLVPRYDSFFVKARYGKRSGWSPGAEAARALLCEFTGVSPLYRCRHKPARTHYDKRSAEDAGDHWEE